MGRKLRVSQPTVINTEMTPLQDTFWLSCNGDTEQWYYENTDTYNINRATTPLTIMPRVTAADTETGTTYSNVQFATTPTWDVYRIVGGVWTHETVTDTSSTPSNLFYKSGSNLIVKANNNNPANSILIVCSARYLDPRNAGLSYSVQASIELTANRDAASTLPLLKITSQKEMRYNPLMASSSNFTITAAVDWSGVQSSEVSNDYQFVWYTVTSSGNEVLADNMRGYVSGQNTDTLVVNALYKEDIKIVLRMKKHSTDTELMPMKDYANITWKIPPVEGIVVCKNGNAVRSNDAEFEFTTIVNTNSGTVSDSKRKNNLRFCWKMRPAKPANSTDVVVGWGDTMYISSSNLLSTYGGKNSYKLVSNDIYMLGAYEVVKSNGDIVTYGGRTVCGRGIDV